VAVARAVAGQERDAPAADVAQVQRAGRRPEGGVDLHLLDALEEVVEPGAAEDPDIGALRHQLAFAVLAVLLEEPDEPFESLEPVDDPLSEPEDDEPDEPDEPVEPDDDPDEDPDDEPDEAPSPEPGPAPLDELDEALSAPVELLEDEPRLSVL